MAHPVDIHVGKRLRNRRLQVGLTQAELAERVGIRFQQIQKYESGANRISASRLWDIAKVLETPVSLFFQGYEAMRHKTAAAVACDLADPAVDELMSLYAELPKSGREKLFELARELKTPA